MDTLDLFRRAAAGFRSRLQHVSDWTVPTPCTEWDARALVNHVVNEVRWVPPLVAGKSIADVGSSLDGDLIGDDALASWDAAVAAVEDECGAPGAMERSVQLSSGDAPAGRYLAEVASDVAIHTWDLARAVGADERLDPDLVELADATFGPMLEGGRAAGIFGPAVPVPDDADAQAKLLGNFGRQP